jgi:hypothetical protein
MTKEQPETHRRPGEVEAREVFPPDNDMSPSGHPTSEAANDVHGKLEIPLAVVEHRTSSSRHEKDERVVHMDTPGTSTQERWSPDSRTTASRSGEPRLRLRMLSSLPMPLFMSFQSSPRSIAFHS